MPARRREQQAAANTMAVATDAAPPPTLAPPTPLLGIVVEVSPNTTPSSSSSSYAKVVEAVVALRNAHLLCHHGGEVLVVAALPGATQFISSDQQNGGAATATALRECAEKADSERKTPAAVAAALGRFLCYAARQTSTARCVLFKCGEDDAGQYHAVMNCLFAARRRKILVDAVSLGAKPSPLAKLCAHLAKGAFTHNPPHLRDRLVAVALATFGADAECRQSLSLPALHEADFRTACLCCTPPKILDRGYVCATCLSVYCRADHECPCTKALRS